MTITPLAQAARPTSRSIRWSPLVGVAAVLVIVLLVARTAQRPSDVVMAIAAAALASVVVASLHDPATDLLAPVPVSVMQRRLLRLALVLVPALLVWVALVVVAPPSLEATSPGPLLAMTAVGVAAGVWSPARRAVLVGASVPVLWFALDMTVPSDVLLGDAAGWWRTDPWPVAAVALGALVAGRRR
ncbi:hypothetical protein [Nocardioides sediminis]|uniref:hypothetical protein n=1 Tax=Nocardioides sediminis TaxID=433648 RepID=UPI00131F0D7E|nr:hypothetical protein [Nocardioides sediminis]